MYTWTLKSFIVIIWNSRFIVGMLAYILGFIYYMNASFSGFTYDFSFLYFPTYTKELFILYLVSLFTTIYVIIISKKEIENINKLKTENDKIIFIFNKVGIGKYLRDKGYDIFTLSFDEILEVFKQYKSDNIFFSEYGLFNIYYDKNYDDFVIEYYSGSEGIDLICESSSELIKMKKNKLEINYPLDVDFDNLGKLIVYKTSFFNFFRSNKGENIIFKLDKNSFKIATEKISNPSLGGIYFYLFFLIGVLLINLLTGMTYFKI